MDKGPIAKNETNENKNKETWKTIGIVALSIFLAVITVVVINI